jgi:hypothetical protein
MAWRLRVVVAALVAAAMIPSAGSASDSVPLQVVYAPFEG